MDKEYKGLWERIFYKYEYLGQVEKDGKLFKKYKKIKRISVIKKNVFVIFIIAAVLLVLMLYDWIMSTIVVKK